MDGFVVDLKDADMDEFQDVMDAVYDEQSKMIQEWSEANEVSISCGSDVFYLRTRVRWTQELEDELIRLHKAGTPPNMGDFGCPSKEMEQLVKDLVKEYKNDYRSLTKEDDCVRCFHYAEDNDECTIWHNLANQGMRDDNCEDFVEK